MKFLLLIFHICLTNLLSFALKYVVILVSVTGKVGIGYGKELGLEQGHILTPSDNSFKILQSHNFIEKYLFRMCLFGFFVYPFRTLVLSNG